MRSIVLQTWPIGSTFTIADVYAFEDELAAKYPDNQNVRAKIRQTLQHLRDAGLIEFVGGDGTYRRVAGAPSGQRVFGELPGFAYGQQFPDRRAVALAGLHPPLRAGISGAAAEGADSIVVSGAYEDDEDYGDVIIYTGKGGRDPDTGLQIEDQEFDGPNEGLRKSWLEGLPVRVIRGADGEPDYAPASGFRYDGLYLVTNAWRERGRSGFYVCRYELRRLLEDGSQAPTPPELLPPGPAPRTLTTTEHVVRITQVVRNVKKLHNNRCQVCGETVDTPSGPYAEGAHIRPLGRPHDGPDVEANVLSLCPNDHVRFDKGSIVLTDELVILATKDGTVVGALRTIPGHEIDIAQVRYHRELHSDVV